MAMPLALQVREQMSQFVGGRQSLTQFEDWFVSAFWSVEFELDAATRDLGYEIELRLAEHSNGDWTEAEMKDMFRQLASRYLVSSEVAPRMAAGMAANYTVSASRPGGMPANHTASESRAAPSLKAA